MAKKVMVKMVRGPHGDDPRTWLIGPPFLPEGYALGPDPVAVSEAAAEVLLNPENEEQMRGRVFVRVGGEPATVVATTPAELEPSVAVATTAPATVLKGTNGPAGGHR